MINDAGPDFLWVGLGAPKQEKWIFDHLVRVHVPVQIGVGAAFDFHSGNILRAPKLIQRLGLEWLYRISQDPRLFKRYLTTNPIFMFLFLRDFIKIRLLNIGKATCNTRV
jgi:N-acetylglucosaminyldiphosphoundecaprenol N-acetyl-beta-D-mannosaminyltransferase